jgi:hypothetical protein
MLNAPAARTEGDVNHFAADRFRLGLLRALLPALLLLAHV